jgi:antirestriction protein ArdC
MKAVFKFNHPNDINIGWGRIVYEPAYDAWALPGGRKTYVRGEAESVATAIHELTTKQWGAHSTQSQPGLND